MDKELALKLLAIRDALVIGDVDEAWYNLYLIADPTHTELKPWAELEKIAEVSNR